MANQADKPQKQHKRHQEKQQSLSSPPSNNNNNNNHLLPAILQQSNNLIRSGATGNMPAMMMFEDNDNQDNSMSSQNIFTIKKGILWQQQNHNKFRQKLFGRWKKRYFILTTDYLVCFKRSSAKVGRSEMGKFLYKTSLGDITKIEWMRPKKSDKGAIIISLKKQLNLFLWSKEDLDEWMLLISESIDRLKLRRSGGPMIMHGNENLKIISENYANGQENGFYENATFAKSCDNTTNGTLATTQNNQPSNIIQQSEIQTSALTSDGQSVNESSTLNSQTHPEGTKVSSRSSSGSRKPLKNLAKGLNNSTSDDHHETSDHLHATNGSNSEQSEGKAKRSDIQSVRKSGKDDNPSANNSIDDRVIERDKTADNKKGGAKSPRSSSEKDDEFLENVSIPPQAYRNVPSYRAQEQEKQSTESTVVAQSSEGKQRVEGRRSSRLERPSGNLIRRDDSWQSLVSLTQVGKSNAPGVQKQSLYAQHQQRSIEGPTPNDGIHVGQFSAAQRQSQRQHLLNLESTATPLRNRPPMRQHSMQAYHSPRLLPQQPIGRQQQRHANSFDVPSPLPASPSFQSNQQQTASYQQKLLQLQLLHNSNNVDYIRANNRGHNQDANNNDYQVYGPGSIATNHYGYYSMRSNLKSAASEFSFIRPSSSNFQHQQPAGQLAEVVGERNSSYMLSGPARRIDNEGKLIVSRDNNHIRLDPNNNHHQLLAQYPMNNVAVVVDQTFQQLGAAQNGRDRLTLAELTAPNRDLPLRPNKKRPAVNSEVTNEKNSLGSSIVCFFKRAFSRRSKRRRPKLVESCSSSLAAFDSNFENIQISQSAFSTGSKSAKVAERMQQLQHVNQSNGPAPPQRMIDLIEAFANQTATDRIVSDQKALISADVNQAIDNNNKERQMYIHNLQVNPRLQRTVQNNLISPLHKSSSMSASIDFSGLNELNHRSQSRRFPNGDTNHLGEHCPSPMASRSTKVMSANLTPLFTRKETQDAGQGEMSMISKKSSRNNLPRPSSIYGQPSLIASPSSAITINGKDGEQFGLHRSSLHAGSNRERITSLNMDARRQQQQQQSMKMPYLDTTCEVSEEISSPTSESRDLVSNLVSGGGIYSKRTNNIVIDNNSINNSVNVSNNYSQFQRHAIVNPILQSPTMSAIYDNHPMVIGQVRETAYSSSHYDNNHPIVHNLGSDDVNQTAHQLFDNALLAGGINSNGGGVRKGYHDNTSEAIISPLISNRFVQDERASRSSTNQTGAFYTPIRGAPESNMRRLNRDDKMSSLADGERVFVHHTKPSAIVAPTTPNHHMDYQKIYSKYPPSTSSDRDHEEASLRSNTRFSGQQQNNSSPLRAQQRGQNAASAVSPIASRRFINQTASYQQSPLVNDQTRILKRNDGVQATIIGSDSAANGNIVGEQVVNIVGAPGVNLDPALAAALLRGTNIDAFQSSTTSRASSSGQANSSTKTFLISSRLSRAGPKDTTTTLISDLDNDTSSSCEPEVGASKVSKIDRNERGDGSSSAGSGSSSSSDPKPAVGRAATKQGARSKSTTSDNGPRSGGASSEASRSSSGSNSNSGGSVTSNRISNGKLRGSSTEQSDELSSQTGSIDEPDEKNWVNSKLV